jgi:hypothetical protein
MSAEHPGHEAQDLAALYREVFSDDRRGAAILEDLHMRFGRVSVHTDGGIDAVLKTFKSGAQAAVIGYIHNRIAQAEGLTPVNAEDPGAIDP